MPPKREALPDGLKAALKQRIAHVKETADRGVEDFYIEVYLMNQGGLTFEDIADALNTRTSTVSDWKKKGEEAHRQRQRPA